MRFLTMIILLMFEIQEANTNIMEICICFSIRINVFRVILLIVRFEKM